MTTRTETPAQSTGDGGAGGPGRGMLFLLAVTCGVAVGNVYFPQAVSPLIADGLGIPPGRATLAVTAAQFGYTAGILLLVPLGDRFAYRPLLVTLLALTGTGLLAAGAAPGLPPLVAAGALVGTTTVIAPLVGPMVAGMVPRERHGTVSGTLASGTIGGILLSRTLGATLGEWLGWRAPYVLMGVVTLLLAAVPARALPRGGRPPGAENVRVASLLAQPLRLLRTEPALRRSCFCQALVFGGFSAVWTSVALLLTGPAYGRGATAVGALAFVNAGTMLCTPLAGRLTDRRGSDVVGLACAAAVAAGAGVLALGGAGGTWGLAALVLGTLLLDVGMQSGTIANTVRLYGLRPEIRSRLTTAFMTCSYLGGTVGSWLGARTYAAVGWWGVCALVALAALAAAVRQVTGRAPV
ncbi:MFS transporter [Streptomyces albiaxialis]|uniref:MFS transporter n=1 Tax=Streptomyces albiaxialis TaxID=329523 RepID=A0ABN2W067_9ACTN